MKAIGWFFVVGSTINLVLQITGSARGVVWGQLMGPTQGLLASLGMLVIGVLMIRNAKPGD